MNTLTLLFPFFFVLSICADGFTADTLIKTNTGYTQIENLKPQDSVICYDFDQHAQIERPIREIHKQHVSKYIRLAVHKTFVHVSPNQKFYLRALNTWETIEKIKNDPELLQALYADSRIACLGEIQQETDVYMLTLDEPHNFFITPHDILVHNFFPMITLIWAFEGFDFTFLTAESLAAIGGSVLSWCGYKLFGKKLYHYDYYSYSDSQLLGQPTKEDGYEPPKRWDGKKVKNPNGLGYGWPDAKGRIWVSSGPNGHGGPHWDVQYPNKKRDYDNVYPGGKVRPGRK